MTTRRRMTALRDWAAFICAVAMVVFLTFAPQNASSLASARSEAARMAATAATVWPSRTAALAGTR